MKRTIAVVCLSVIALGALILSGCGVKFMVKKAPIRDKIKAAQNAAHKTRDLICSVETGGRVQSLIFGLQNIAKASQDQAVKDGMDDLEVKIGDLQNDICNEAVGETADGVFTALDGLLNFFPE